MREATLHFLLVVALTTALVTVTAYTAYYFRTEDRQIARCSATVRAYEVTAPARATPPVYELRVWTCYPGCGFRRLETFDTRAALMGACESSK